MDVFGRVAPTPPVDDVGGDPGRMQREGARWQFIELGEAGAPANTVGCALSSLAMASASGYWTMGYPMTCADGWVR